ncbi:AMP-binding protein [Nocardiopsis alba]|uniref:AMP-binding protein n=1 Tax=Nocardiopsis alba TaxID=53437 RepID=UPI003D74C68F
MSDPAQLLRDWIATYHTPTTSVAHLLCDRHDPHTTATTQIGPTLEPTTLTYGQLQQKSTTLAAGLHHLGIRPGDRIATLIPKGIDLTITALATWRLGATLVPLLTSLAPSAIHQRLTDSGTTLVIAQDDYRTKLDPGPHQTTPPTWHTATTGTHPLRDGDHTLHTLTTDDHTPPPTPPTTGDTTLALVYVSNLIGPPRGARVPVRALAAMHAYHHYGLGVTDDDTYWNTADPGTAYGLYHGLISPLLAGHTSLALQAGFFDPELTLDVLGMYQVTNFASDPTTYRTIRAATKTLPPEIIVQRLASAGEPLAPDVIDWATDLFGIPIRDHYGQTELGWCAGIPNNPDLPQADAPLPPGAIGPALPGWNIHVLDPIDDQPAPLGVYGRIAIDHTTSPLDWFEGYHGYDDTLDIRHTPDHTHHLTGDTGIMDRQGNLHFSTRDDGAIITRSYRIGPTEVETILTSHPAVDECGVYAIPDPIAGHLVGARIVLAPDHTDDPHLADELRDWVSTHLAPHAAPHTIDFVDELPRTASGKMRRARLP